MMRVALRATSLLSPFTGIAQYVRSLALELQALGEVDLQLCYAGAWSNQLRSTHVPGISRPKKAIRNLVPFSHALFRALEQTGFDRGVRSLKPTIYHEPAFLPLRFDGPMVLTAHDLSWIRYPETHPAERVRLMNRQFPSSLARSHHIITDALYTRAEIIRQFSVDPTRVTAIPLGARSIFRPRSSKETQALLDATGLRHRSFLLCVGTLEPRKNLEFMIRTYASLTATFREKHPLVLVGMKGWLTSSLESVMRPLVRSGHIRALGFATDEDLAVLYASAAILVYPSLYEGFGLPPLEAMSSGTPVIVSNRTTLPEVVGDAGVLVDPTDDAGLKEAIVQLSEDRALWEDRRTAGLARASEFSWARCAKETLQIYRKVLAAA